MIYLSQGQFDALEELIEFARIIQGKKIQRRFKNEYYLFASTLFNRDSDYLEGSLFAAGKHTISDTTSDNFESNFNQLFTDYSKNITAGEKEKYSAALQDWLQSIRVSKKQLIAENTINKNILSIFENSTWVSYERMENSIGFKIISFKSFNGNKCEVKIEVSPDTHPWQGTATYSQTENIFVIVTQNTGTGSDYTHLLVPVDELQKGLDLCIGHMTYKHRRNLNAASKSIILKKIK